MVERPVLWALSIAIIAVVPFVASPKWLVVAVQIGIAVIGCLGLNLLVGYTGQISIGQGGFLAVGAYTAGYFITRQGVPTLVAIAIALVFSLVIGVIVGLPALRLHGLYLAIATLASQTITIWVVSNWEWLTDGTGSFVVPPPEVFGFRFDTDFRWYWLVVAVAVVALIVMRNIVESNFGRAFVAVRDAEVAGSVVGVAATNYKLLSFAIASVYVGLAGAMIGSWRSVVTWERFTVDISILYLAMIIVGGLGTLRGSVLGAAAMTALPVLIDDVAHAVREQVPILTDKLPAIQHMTFGLIIIVFLIRFPGGIADIPFLRSKAASQPISPLAEAEVVADNEPRPLLKGNWE